MSITYVLKCKNLLCMHKDVSCDMMIDYLILFTCLQCCYVLRIIADEWLEVCVEDAAAGEQLISSAQQLRSSWCKLLDSQLQGNVQALYSLVCVCEGVCVRTCVCSSSSNSSTRRYSL